MGKFKQTALVALMTVGLVVGGTLPSFAATSGTGGASQVGDSFGNLVSDITTTYIPAFIGLVLLGIGFRMGIKWLRKGASNA